MNELFVLSGAGLSADSGIKTFRDNDGLWENHDVMEVCSATGWQKNRQKVTDFYNKRRLDLQDKSPNKMHYFLASLEQKYKDNYIHLSQNVDNLCEKAGAKKLVHLHGTLTDLRCESCSFIWDIGYKAQKKDHCPRCDSQNVRHNVVMFGESAPNYKYLYSALETAKIFVAIGTSGQVIDVVPFAKEAVHSIYVNIKKEPYVTSFGSFEQTIDSFFTDQIIASATDSVEALDELITKYINEYNYF